MGASESCACARQPDEEEEEQKNIIVSKPKKKSSKKLPAKRAKYFWTKR